jgi:hypothetical protein
MTRGIGQTTLLAMMKRFHATTTRIEMNLIDILKEIPEIIRGHKIIVERKTLENALYWLKIMESREKEGNVTEVTE